MGEIAEMHLLALEAGLDPNEMDGADWADFFDARDEERSLETTIACLSGDCRGILCWIDDLGLYHCDDGTTERAALLRKFVPEFSEPEKLVALIEELNGKALAVEDKLEEDRRRNQLIECNKCGKLCKGERGLRDHWNAKHREKSE